MAAYNRPTSASYVLHEQVTVDTRDHEDHTFCGMMFPVECKKGLPIDHMVITSLSVRGALGPMTVWVSKEKKKKKPKEEPKQEGSIDEEDEKMAASPSTLVDSCSLSPTATSTSSKKSITTKLRRMVTRSSSASSAATADSSVTAVVTPIRTQHPMVTRAASASTFTSKKQRCDGSKHTVLEKAKSVITPTKKKVLRSQEEKIVQFSTHPKKWKKIYEDTHEPDNFREFVELKLDEPIKLMADDIRGIYVHSGLENSDEGIVYDNHRSWPPYTHDDQFLRIRPGMAHLSPQPFGRTNIWGYGRAWRESREFVGRVNYGIVYKLWNPEQFFEFGSNFQIATRTMFMCQRRMESPLSQMPDDVLFYILNMCRWDWFDDTAEQVKEVAEQNHEQQQAKLFEEDGNFSWSFFDEDDGYPTQYPKQIIGRKDSRQMDSLRRNIFGKEKGSTNTHRDHVNVKFIHGPLFDDDSSESSSNNGSDDDVSDNKIGFNVGGNSATHFIGSLSYSMDAEDW